MNRQKSKAGFTLVELIIVIAILGILAGIAVPVYSGYITKAHKAADNQLLAALNTAFAAASIDGGEYSGRPQNAAATLFDDGTVDKVVSTVDRDGSLFEQYYGENKNSKFKVITSLYYNKADGVFENAEGTVEQTFIVGDTTYTVSVKKEDLAAFDASTFGLSDTITTESLMKSVEAVVNNAAAKTVSTENLDQFTGNAFSNYLKSVLNMSDEQIAGLSNLERANALVLLAADGASGMKASDVLDSFVDVCDDDGNVTGKEFAIIQEGNAVTQMTIPYALAMAYANTEGAEVSGTISYKFNDLKNDMVNAGYATNMYNEATGETVTEYKDGLSQKEAVALYLTDIYGGSDYVTVSTGSKKATVTVNPNNYSASDYFSGISSSMSYNQEQQLVSTISNLEGFQTYMQSSQATTDINGFLGAMSMIDSNVKAGNVSADDLLTNGFADENLIEMVKQFIGD